MKNPFDNLGYYDFGETGELNGMFSSIKKAVKKATKNVKKAVKKVHKAHINAVKNPLKELKNVKGHLKEVDKLRTETEKNIDRALYGKKIADKISKVRHSKEAKKIELIAGAAVATYFGAPLVGKAIMGINGGAKVATAAKVAAGKIAPKVVSAGVSVAAKKELAKKQEQAATQNAKIAIENAKNDLYAALNLDSDVLNRLRNDKDFQRVVEGLIKKGGTPDQIMSAWFNSDTFQYMTRKNVPKTIQPLIYSDYVASGIPPSIAADQSYYDANVITDNELEKAENKLGGNDLFKIALIGAPILLTLIGK